VLHLPDRIIIMPKIKNDIRRWQLHKLDFRPFENIVQVHQALRLPRKMTILIHACERFSNVKKVPRLPCRWKSDRCPAPVTQNDVLECFKTSKNVADVFETSKMRQLFWASLRSRNARGHLRIYNKIAGARRGPESVPWSNPGIARPLTLTVRTPQCGHTARGI